MKKNKIIALSSAILSLVALASCGQINQPTGISSTVSNETSTPTSIPTTTPTSTPTSIPTSTPTSIPSTTPSYTVPIKEEDKLDLANQGAEGFLIEDMPDFSQYVNTSAYVTVSTPSEFLNALMDAKIEYSATVTEKLENNYVVRNNVRKNETNWKSAITKGLYLKNEDGTFTKIPEDTPWDENDTKYTATMVYYEDSPYDEITFTQELTKENKVHVIEITQDLNLGYNVLSDADKALSIVNNFAPKANINNTYTQSTMFKENGISQIAIERTKDLLIYSKNGSKITHAGFKINYSKNIAVRNLEMDEIWQWEDSSLTTASKVGDYDAYGWAYFKVGFSDNVWIDHCTFGKSYDGQIDVANPYFSTMGTYKYAAYQANGSSDVHISWCNFKAGSADKDGYLYKMMEEVEADYQNNQGNNYLYYKKLRDNGISFEDILHGIAIPQKKGFLLGDSGDEYKYNLNLNISFANCYFQNIEDRLPKIRGGNAYMYNCVINNLDYMYYRTKLTNLGAKTLVTQVNSSWKCALVSQGIVCGLGGSVMANGCIFRGIQDLLKNNDSSFSNKSNMPGVTYNGGYKIVDSEYQLNSSSEIITDSSKMSNSTPTKLSEEFFKWNTEDGECLFTPEIVGIDKLEEFLFESKYSVGVNTLLQEYLLLTEY